MVSNWRSLRVHRVDMLRNKSIMNQICNLEKRLDDWRKDLILPRSRNICFQEFQDTYGLMLTLDPGLQYSRKYSRIRKLGCVSVGMVAYLLRLLRARISSFFQCPNFPSFSEASGVILLQLQLSPTEQREDYTSTYISLGIMGYYPKKPAQLSKAESRPS